MENSRASSMNLTNRLENGLIESILAYLPLREAARTSVLSTRWRHRWCYMPRLVFDDAFYYSMRRLLFSPHPQAVIDRINRIVSGHRGQILKFTLAMSDLISIPEINQLINGLLGNGLQDLTLYVGGFYYHPLPLGIYAHPQLTHLNLRYILFVPPPPTFHKFHRLISLVLCEVRIVSGVLAFLISSSPQLEQLTVERCHVNHLEIVASNLKSFRFSGLLESVGVINAPVLAVVFMDIGFPHTMRYYMQGIQVNLIGFLRSLSAVENLHLDYFYVQRLRACNLGIRFINLQVLKLSNISFDHKEVFGMLTLIGNCPNLRKVTITVYSRDLRMFPVGHLYARLECTSFSFNRMREMKIVSVTGSEMEMGFIKFVLARSPQLRKMILILSSSLVPASVPRVVVVLSDFHDMSSPFAQVILENPFGFGL